jgi:hypothetical protein
MKLKMGKKRALGVLFGVPFAAAAAAVLAFSAAASAATVPLINVAVGASAGGVAGYYGADDGHSHFRYVQTTVVASPTLNNLNGVGTPDLGAAGVELCDENTGMAAQIGLYDNGGTFGVVYASPADGTLSSTFDDPCIEGGTIIPVASAHPLFGANTPHAIHAGDRLLLSVYYNPAGHFLHQLQFSVTDLSQVNEHRSVGLSVHAQSFSEYGIGVVSNASSVTAALNNNVDTFTGDVVNCYSCTKPAFPISQEKAFYGYAGLSQVQFVNVSDQPEMSPSNSLSGSAFTVFEGSTTP